MRAMTDRSNSKANPFYRLVSPGVTPRGRLFVEIDYRGGRLSITGVEGPMSNGDARGSCGQTGIDADITPNAAEGWDAGKIKKLREIWERWHLNDMRAGCEHQQQWDTAAVLELQELTWGPLFNERRRLAESGKLTGQEYGDYSAAARQVYRLTIEPNRAKHPTLWGVEGVALLASGYVVLGKKETKGAGWVYPSEHPEGLLMKPCPTCGYRYGSAWLKEPVPASVLGFLRRLKDTSCTYAWSRRRSA